MKNIPYVVLILLSVACSTPISQAEEDAVRQVVLDFQQDFNDDTFNKAETYATDDWVHINPEGGIDIGKGEVLESVRGVHQTFLNGVSITIDSMNVRFITHDVAVATAYHSIDEYMTPDSVVHSNERHIKSYVVVREEGTWRLTLDHNTVIL